MKQTFARLAISCTLVACSALPAAAQDDRRIGLSFAFPGAVGVQWDVTDAFSLRADGGYSRTRAESSTGFVSLFPAGTPIPALPVSTSVTTSHDVSIGVSAMWAVHSRDQLKVYLAPRIGISLYSQNTEFDFDLSGLPPSVIAALSLPARNADISETDTSPEFGVILGTSYRLAPRFGIFAEGGAAYTRRTFDRSGTLESTFTSVGIRSGVGGILYF
jgi:hypothetical protein